MVFITMMNIWEQPLGTLVNVNNHFLRTTKASPTPHQAQLAAKQLMKPERTPKTQGL